ncbi:Lacal_2735 family protein [Winogradskyella sp.]|uniref:Lacal_2735 family protein n=1 Tax=Winogradskyella sp. TaxID=1883156 RepID=UPI0025D4988C|nr:Lacal_2735 family protein [Winogradskyella sp.]
MNYSKKLAQKRNMLMQEYLGLIEDAYNLRQTDHALSDFSEYRAKKVLHEINKLSFITDNSFLRTS